MKKHSILFAFFILSFMSVDAQWDGSTSSSGDIWRTGYVGLGTTSPSVRLHVHGKTAVGTTKGFANITDNATFGNASGLLVGNAGSILDNNNTALNIVSRTALNFYVGESFASGAMVAMHVDYNGNVGVGTSSPSSLFQVNGRASVGTNLGSSSITDVTKFGSASGLFIGDAGSILDNDNAALNLISRGALRFFVNEASGTGASEALFINASGDVGVGTTSPDAKLTVKGKIHTEEVLVDLNVPFPDYVFEESYDLLPLEDLRIYINQFGRLPNVPSAKEVAKNGIELAKLNVLLVEKIEEITLYILELEEKIIELESAK